MKKVNALRLRQSLGSLLRELEEGGEPISVERHNRPVAVLISPRDFKERFADHDAFEERRQLVAEIHEFRKRQVEDEPSTVAVLRELRDRG
ncbi:MAG: hypothetical protein A2289_03395 [Deltaproteobacteria bacterium RIFOXYA12_FULL_58_15]|nr:MAG: hypothetical protein A2289_03395 [Deltaproteobacteria bacterium RIFOXYA12_FULL_58_15]OGR14231.1 MAG: hypothetical protein A2341_13490 [Deltaproteobacteria bacterium RIFOXYB12_FULL_58_9]